MNVEFNIEKKHLYILLSCVILCTSVLGVIAYNSGSAPNVFGHSGEEIEVVIDDETKLLNIALNEITDELAEGYSLLLKGSEYVEESKTTITASGIEYEVDHSYYGQIGDHALFNWPSEQPSKIVFKVNSLSDDYCVGGDGHGDILGNGGGSNARCMRYDQRGNTESRATITEGDWIQIYINGVKQIGCTTELGRSAEPGYPGLYGYVGRYAASCSYSVDDELSEIIVETADWSGGYGSWEWELFYR